MQNMKEKIIKTINFVLGENVVTLDDLDLTLENVGLDSLVFIHLVLELESELNIEVPDEYLILAQFNTVNKIYDIVKKISSDCA